MTKKKLFIWAVVMSILGLALLLGGAMLQTDHPNIITPLGLLITLIGAALTVACWVWYLIDALKTKRYLLAACIAAPGAVFMAIEAIRILK